MNNLKKSLTLSLIILLISFLGLGNAIISAHEKAPVTQNEDGSYSLELAVPGGNVMVSFGMDANNSLTNVSVSGAAADTQVVTTEEGLNLLINNNGQVTVVELRIKNDDGVLEARYKIDDDDELDEDEAEEEGTEDEDEADENEIEDGDENKGKTPKVEDDQDVDNHDDQNVDDRDENGANEQSDDEVGDGSVND